MNPHEDVEPAPLARTSRSRAWLLPAVGVAIVLGGVIYLGRSGTDSPRTAAIPTQGPGIAFGPGLTARPSASSNPSPDSPPTLPGVEASTPTASPASAFGEREGGQRFVDGLPTSFDGQPVLRVEDALQLPAGASVLVGGWYHSIQCPQDSMVCPIATLSDDPAGLPHSASMVVTGTDFWLGERGPRILRGTTTQTSECPTHDNIACSLWLDVGSIVWVGDALTDTDPITPISALGALTAAFPDLEFRPFLEARSCPVKWPSQTYLATEPDVARANAASLPVRLVILFPSTFDRINGARDIETAAESMSSFDAANRCVGLATAVSPDSWLARDNVLVLLGDNGDAVARQVRKALGSAG